jgi:hypothetical protein
MLMARSGWFQAVVLSLATACTDPSYTMVHVDVKPQPGLTLDSYDVRVAEFEHSMPPTNTFDVVVPTDAIGQPTTIVVAAMNGSKQVAYGAAMVTPALGITTDTSITLAASTCPTTCTQGEIVCSGQGEATITCQLGSDGCYDWSAPTACPSARPFCSNGACAASCSNDCTSVGQTDCDGDAVRTCQTSQTDSCLHWSVPVECDSPPLDTCVSETALQVYGPGTCSNGACAYASMQLTCDAPANGTATCSDATCGFTCNTGYVPDGNGNCVMSTTTCSVTSCTVDADCGDPACGPCFDGTLCLGAGGL